MYLLNIYGSLDEDIHIKVLHEFNITDPYTDYNTYLDKLQKSLYGLKQSGKMWQVNFLFRKENDTQILIISHVCL
jgi:hypothetical protein